MSRMSGLKYVQLEGLENELTQRIMVDISKHCPKVESLSYQEDATWNMSTVTVPLMPSLTDVCVEAKAKHYGIHGLSHLPNLTSLKVSGLYIQFGYDFVLRDGLKELDLRGYRMQEMDVIVSSPAIETLERISLDVDVSGLSSPFRAPNLKYLGVKCVSRIRRMYEAHDETALNLIRSLPFCPNLETLNIRDIEEQTPSVESFRFLPKLKHVFLPSFGNANQVIRALALNSPLIEVLRVTGMKDDGAEDALNAVSCLQHLKVLEIGNKGHTGLTLKELEDFVVKNTVDGEMRFTFTLCHNEFLPDPHLSKILWTLIDWRS